MTTTDHETDHAALLRPVLADLRTVVAGIPDDAEHAPTPCTELDVAALRNHVVQWLSSFADGLADGEAKPSELSTDRAAAPDQVGQAGDRVLAAVADGAAERTVQLPMGEMPGDLVLRMIGWEYQLHGWDLARATGQDWDPPAAAVETSIAFAGQMLNDDSQGPGKSFADPVPVPDDAPPLDRLLGQCGRDPRWQA